MNTYQVAYCVKALSENVVIGCFHTMPEAIKYSKDIRYKTVVKIELIMINTMIV